MESGELRTAHQRDSLSPPREGWSGMHWGLKAGDAPTGPDIPIEAPASSGVGSNLPWGPHFALKSKTADPHPQLCCRSAV